MKTINLNRLRAEACAMAGYTMAETAREVGVSYQRVQQYGLSHPSGRRGYSAIDRAFVRRLRQMGLKLRHVELLTGCSLSAIRLFTDDTGTPTPPLAEAFDHLAAAMVMDGATVKETAELIGEPRPATSRRLARMRLRGWPFASVYDVRRWRRWKGLPT